MLTDRPGGHEQRLKKMKTEHKKKLFYSKGGQTLAQVGQRGCEVSILGDIQNSAGHGCGQRALGGRA